ncbi:hypothetical protein M1L60_31050 [Actinoplanes sp. TRM 88003]|uniref:Transmembrane protein n=1 Tax=Paractinoplanes aksuensis TaxID=2939490 RepID=A0ABT1DW76_9ACTN|nr:hypothetical protein [Actinoplanes aksuensis]MCO8275025.1 hypothetical protein [Actinoplanes aksuensis]
MSALTRGRAIALLAVLVVVAFLAGLLAGLGDGLSGLDWALLLLVAVVGLGILVFVVERPWVPATVEPADQEAVARALDEGGTTDPRIDRLAREAAERAASRMWFVWLLGICAALQMAAAVTRAVVGGNWLLVVMSAVLCVSLGLTGWSTWTARRRAVRYLA